MELKHIKELMTAMERTGTTRLKIKREGFELALEREGSPIHQFNPQQQDSSLEPHRESIQVSRADQAFSRSSEASAGRLTHSTVPEIPKDDVNSRYVPSPMVGTFYTAASPEDAPFIKVGDRVEKNTVVCIIEAMKVMNEIKANATGTVVEVLVESGQPVEFGTKLFRIVEPTT